jgi:hypothetical protein
MTLEYSLFNAADDCLAQSLKGGVFEESLLLNILFQERLLLHEAYFFNSTLLVDHMKRTPGTPTLFEVAARAGLIVPAFRNPNTQSLEEAFVLMKQEYGQDYVLLSPDVLPYKDKILAAVEQGLKTVKPFYWPTDMPPLGESYETVVRSILQADEVPSYAHTNTNRDQLLRRVWEVSKPWRLKCVDDAVSQTLAKGSKGLQRAELFCSIGWSLGVPRAQATVMPADIVDRCDEPEKRLAMEIFLKWVSQCYHLNQAQSFHTAINFPVYDLDEDFIVDSLLRSPLDAPPPMSEGFRCEVMLPPLQVLLTANSADLVQIRTDLGGGYMYALRRWQKEPSIDNEHETRAALQQYCDEICQYYDSGIRQRFVATMTQGTSSPWGELGRTAASGFGAASGLPLGIFSQMTKTVSTVYRYFRQKRRNTRAAPSARAVEVTLPS